MKMTGAERQAASIAKALVKVLVRFERSIEDPDIMLDDLYALHASKGVKDAVRALQAHYRNESTD